MRLTPVTVLAAACALLGACAVPASSSRTAATNSHDYEAPDTGSMFGGGDRSGLSNGFNDPGLQGTTTVSGSGK